MNEEGHKTKPKDTKVGKGFVERKAGMGSWEEKRGKGDSNKNILWLDSGGMCF